MNPYDRNSFHPGMSGPFHAGIIPDGTRRWALTNNVSPAGAYMLAGTVMKEVIICFLEEGVHEISIYLSSEQNFKRTGDEVDAFCRAGASFSETLLAGIAESFGLKVVPVGNMGIIPGYLRDALERVKQMTAGNSGGRINLCVAYNPVEEVFDAARHAGTCSDVLKGLWVKTPLDLVVRTGGANLLSNFLPMQSGFARLYFLEKMFNDVEVDEIRQIVASFREIKRNYGE